MCQSSYVGSHDLHSQRQGGVVCWEIFLNVSLIVTPLAHQSASSEKGGDYLQGDIPECIAYGYALNSAERIIVENYLGNKYGISIANDKFSYESRYGEDITGIGR